ncbi:MAG TPA: pre-peptidase C-terminal domain-containing protein [Thermoanaerobaculia bacterium]|nr:pre-peptidase C-terminal domain-containing protein [Thermoanaerobaculia bacterium]
MSSRSRALPIIFLLIGLLTLSGMASAIVPKQNDGPLGSIAFVSEKLQANAEPESLDDVRMIAGAGVTSTWDTFRVEHGEWNAMIDKRTGGIEIAEGEGIAFVPGRGNQLRVADISGYLGGRGSVDLATMESITRAFLPRVAGMLGVDPKTLQLNAGRSGHPAEHLWFIDFDVVRNGMVIDGARVAFRVNNGNLIQFGTENLPAQGVTAPKAKLARKDALATLSAFIGGFSAADTFIDGGSLHLMTVRLDDARFAEGYAPAKGRGLLSAWQFVFRRAGDNATWRARIDARTGEVLELRDINDYAQVTGGAKILGASTNLPMPFANVSSGGFTNSAGIYSYPGGTVTSTLSGQYVGITDNCGAISKAADASGNILFGTSTGTDCTTPGSGGAGNTHSARTQFYHVNRAKEIARGWLPSNTWLSAKLTANVNINNTCNAFWNGSTINFYRSGGGCGNTGEIEGVSIHEYGHGIDSNDGNGSSPENGTGETYGDWTAALATHSSCVGSGFLTSNCGGYGDSCTSCTGVRDIDFAKHTSGVAHTVSNFTQTRCPTSAIGYVGPCNREGHCESYVSSEALWDFVNRDLPGAGTGSAWAIADRLWYLSRSTATQAFTCTASGTWTSSGCNTGSLWKTLRAVDDDDGNLANGTPHSAALFAAFNRHGIACTTDSGASTSFRGCTQPATPTVTLTPGDNSVSVAIGGSTGVFDLYRNERGCNAGFIKTANNISGSFTDTAVANGFTYFYQVTAEPSGNEACASAPSTCVSVTPTGGTPTPDFSISASPSAVSIAQGASGSSTITTAVSGGFSSAVALSASGLPSGVTVSFSPSSIAAPGSGSSTMTITVASTAATGTSTITVTGTGGSITHTTAVSLTVTTAGGGVTALTNGVPVTGLSGATGSQQFFSLAVPAGATNLTFQISGGTGDADLYVRFGAQPTTSTWDCRPFLSGNSEACNFATPQTGTYFVLINGFSAFSGVTLVGSYTAPGGGTELITNGGFEGSSTPWVLAGSSTRSTGSFPHSGTGYLILGAANSATATTYQQITIPAGSTAGLTFWLNVTSDETTTTTIFDQLFVEVRNTSGTLLATLATYSNLNKGTAGVYSQKGSFSLASFAGQTVRIQFRATTDSSLLTSFRVDDVSVH